MIRFAILPIFLAVASLAPLPAKADIFNTYGQKLPFYSTVVPHAAYAHPVQYWSAAPRDPAIARTLRFNPPGVAAPMPAPPQYAPVPPPPPQWQQPTYPGSRFSYPQQGFYPREGYQNQHPGYEYDSNPAPGYGSLYPMEGASWRSSGAMHRAGMRRSGLYGTNPRCPAY